MEPKLHTPSRHRRSRQQILHLLSTFRASGSSVKDFCSAHNISKGTFHKWQSRYQNQAVVRSSPSAFAQVDICPGPSSLLFAEVNGIRIYQPVPATSFKELAR
jgi:hypothetical protein